MSVHDSMQIPELIAQTESLFKSAISIKATRTASVNHVFANVTWSLFLAFASNYNKEGRTGVRA